MAQAGAAANGHGWAMALVLAAGALVIGCGNLRLPLDGHEVLVVRTAEEMQARGDRLVPYFNGEPRLNKPPLSYWLTGLAAVLSGAGGDVRAWHGRAVSGLAGLAALVSTWLLGAALGAPRAGVLGAGLLAGSAGFYAFTHDARPDMLYAALCTAALAAWAWAARGRRPALFLSLMWAAFAAAVLTKGPQLPAMLIAALLVHLRCQGVGLAAAARRLALLPGAAAAGALALGWWGLLALRLGPAALAGSQLSGSLLMPELSGLLDPYYAWRPLQLLLPWLALIPFALAGLRARDAHGPARRLLLLCWLVPALALSLGPQQRWFYMLPALPAACLWLGFALEALSGRAARWFWGLHLALFAALALYVASRAPAAPMPWLALAAAVTALVLALLRRHRQGPLALGTQLMNLACACLLLAGLAQTPLPWSEDRYNKHRLALAARTLRRAGEPLLAWDVNPAVYVHYTGRRIPRLDSRQALLEEAGAATALVLLPGRHLEALSRCVDVTRLGTIPHGESGTTQLARITAPAGPRAAAAAGRADAAAARASRRRCAASPGQGNL